MKAYPVIYSRTKYVDFLPDFIVRPEGLELRAVKKYIENAIDDLDTVSGVRYFSFPAENYVVFGISCFSKTLADMVKGQVDILPYQDFLSDEKSRKISCIIGYAIPRSEVSTGIPKVSLLDYWNTYITRIKRQWLIESKTTTEIVNNPIDISVAESSNYMPNFNPLKGKQTIKCSNNGSDNIVPHFVRKALNGEPISFISDVNTIELFNNLVFTHAETSEKVEKNILMDFDRFSPEPKRTGESSNATDSMNTEFGQITRLPTTDNLPSVSHLTTPQKQSKTNPFVPVAITAGIVIVLLVILLIILLTQSGVEHIQNIR